MKERPIIFSGEGVRAIQVGTKTQTRRVVKRAFPHVIPATGETVDCIKDMDGMPSRLDWAPRDWECCPYGLPGDGLWVRETWHFVGTDMLKLGRTHSRQVGVVEYRDGYRRRCETHWEHVERWMTRRDQWRSPIHMPRWASRIKLEITGVRVERLQEISEADAMAEGVPFTELPQGRTVPDALHRGQFADMWESLHGAGAWDANPWVWVIEFRTQQAATTNQYVARAATKRAS